MKTKTKNNMPDSSEAAAMKADGARSQRCYSIRMGLGRVPIVGGLIELFTLEEAVRLGRKMAAAEIVMVDEDQNITAALPLA